MRSVADSFEHEHEGHAVLYGRGRVAALGDRLADRGIEDTPVVCGSNAAADSTASARLRAGRVRLQRGQPPAGDVEDVDEREHRVAVGVE